MRRAVTITYVRAKGELEHAPLDLDSSRHGELLECRFRMQREIRGNGVQITCLARGGDKQEPDTRPSGEPTQGQLSSNA